MVTTDISQLNSECSTWIINLRNYREDLNKSKATLQDIASRQTSKDTLQEIEHFQNQFQIQLFNVHDLKLAVKEHERVATTQLMDKNTISDPVWTKHESLYDSYHQLAQTLIELKDDFQVFIQSLH